MWEARGDDDPQTRQERLEAKVAHLEGKRLVRRGTGMIVGGTSAIAGSGLLVGLTAVGLGGCSDWDCVLWTLAMGGSVAIGVGVSIPSVVVIGVGSSQVVKGKAQVRATSEVEQAARYRRRPVRAGLAPVALQDGAGLAMVGRF